MSEKKEILHQIGPVNIEWDLNKGKLNFLDIPSALFWLDPSLLHMLEPIAQEVGKDLFCLLVAHSSSFGTKEDYQAMVTKLADNFEDGFVAWSEVVAAAGWGKFTIEKFDREKKYAEVTVEHPWELVMQQTCSSKESKWGCPFLKGKLIGIFSNALEETCWAEETIESWDDNSKVRFVIESSKRTIPQEIIKLRNNRLARKAKKLQEAVSEKTQQLETAHKQLADYSNSLEERIEQRTIELRLANERYQEEIRRKDQLMRVLSRAVQNQLKRINRPLEELNIVCDDQCAKAITKISALTDEISFGLESILNAKTINSEDKEKSENKISLKTLIDETARSVEKNIETLSNSIFTDIEDDLGEVTDQTASLLEQIILNLLVSTIGTASGNFNICIKTDTSENKDSLPTITIKIASFKEDEETANKREVYVDFNHADDAILKEFQNSLLNLTVASELASGLSGSFRIGSKLGIGFVFEVSFLKQALGLTHK